MNGRTVFVLGLLVLCSLFCVRPKTISQTASESHLVHNLNSGLNYTSIQDAVNANETLNGHTIFVEAGIYNENIVLNKSVSLIGEDRNTTVIDVLGAGTAVQIVADRVLVENFTIRNGGAALGECGIKLVAAERCMISWNALVNNGQDSIVLSYSRNNSVTGNFVVDSGRSGIVVHNSANNIVERNKAIGSKTHGILIQNSSQCQISENSITRSLDDGIAVLASMENIVERNTVTLSMGYGIRLDDPSCNNAFIENVVADNEKGGFWMWYSYNNSLYRNFCNNTRNAIVLSAPGYNSTNMWDGGADIWGNFWSDYNGSDSDHDGIGDTPYIIDANNSDNYPIMGVFQSFSTSSGFAVQVVSNSTIDYFEYFESNRTIVMFVSSMTANQACGFCRMSIPTALMNNEKIGVIVDDGRLEVLFRNFTLYHDATHVCIYFAYEHSASKIVVIPEFACILPLIVPAIVALAVTLLSKQLSGKWLNQNRLRV